MWDRVGVLYAYVHMCVCVLQMKQLVWILPTNAPSMQNATTTEHTFAMVISSGCAYSYLFTTPISSKDKQQNSLIDRSWNEIKIKGGMGSGFARVVAKWRRVREEPW